MKFLRRLFCKHTDARFAFDCEQTPQTLHVKVCLRCARIEGEMISPKVL